MTDMMTYTPTPLEAWLDATADLRKSIFDAAYPERLEAIRVSRVGTVKPQNEITKTQEEQARRMANGVVLHTLNEMEEFNGVRNPIWDDPQWGHNAQEKAPAAAPRPNKYAGKCGKCGGWVEANAGTITKQNGRWVALHIGECPAQTPAVEGIDLSGLVPGYYAVPGGDTRLKVAISTGAKGGKWDGYWFVKDGAEYGAGQRYGMQRPGQNYRGKIEDELRTILADPKAAMQAYGKLVGRCGACGRKLEDAESIKNGIGPVCAKKW